MNEDGLNLYIWGRKYNRATQLSGRVLRAAAGENHILFQTDHGVYGMGSNKFGQLGFKEEVQLSQAETVFQGFQIAGLACGAEHTFFITDEKQVYSCGLNIKGQLGHSLFQNCYAPELVVSLLPSGKNSPKAQNAHFAKPTKPALVNILQKHDLQVKVDQERLQDTLLLASEEYISDIACGALFTIVLSSKGRVFGCGFQSVKGVSREDQIERFKFKSIALQGRIVLITAGLSASAALSKDGGVYIWGRFGKLQINQPKLLQREALLGKTENDKWVGVGVGDQFAALLNLKGEVYVLGQNFDNQLGLDSTVGTFRDKLTKVDGLPFCSEIYVGRNTTFAVSNSKREVFGWGSNKYNQISPLSSLRLICGVTALGITLPQRGKLICSSYCTLALSGEDLQFPQEKTEPSKVKEQEMVPMAEYRKLLNDYQVLKSLNLSLLDKYAPAKTVSNGVQTSSKFEIDGITKFRKFNSNTEIKWSELQLEAQINEGGYGVIHRAKWRQIKVVVKKFKIQNGNLSIQDFLSQCHAMEAVRHPHIVMFLGAVTMSPHYSIILEYCPMGSLWSYLQNHDNIITWQERRRFSIEIAQAVHYLHMCTPPILHRDLKSLNIFLDGNLKIKIGDFGWTKTLEEYMTNKIGTYQWMAPQVIAGKPYTEKVDIFSYSIILWEISSREPPYRNISGAKVSEDVVNKGLRPTIPKKTPQAYSRLMRRCWDPNPASRPSFREIIEELQIMKL